MPVPDWPLSARGRARAGLLATRPWAASLRAVFSSAERKATETASLLAAPLGLPVTILAALGENDRSATGYRPRAEFEALADAFFARPEEQVAGWESAAAAQRRIVAAIGTVLAQAPPGDIAVIAHGGVGALLLCHVMRVPISRSQDQPGEGGGHHFAIAAASRRLLAGWRRIED